MSTPKAYSDSDRGTHFRPTLSICAPVAALYTGLDTLLSPPVSSFPCPAPPFRTISTKEEL